MKLSTLLSLSTLIIPIQSLEIFKRPTLQDAARIARTLISRESLVNINTVYQSGDEAGLPTSFVEYYADCGDGNPVILAVDLGTSFRNINAGSPSSLTIRTGDHSFKEEVSREYPGSRPDSVAGSPRINLRGEFKIIESGEEYDNLEKCFLNRHKDAAWWLPGNPIHKSHFVKFEVKDAYFLGGFGDTGYIGKISSKYYHNAKLLDDLNDVQIKRIDNENINDYAFQAYMMKHKFKEFKSSFIFKIDKQIDHFKSLLNHDKQEIIVENTDIKFGLQSESILDIISTNFEKRDYSNDLSKDKLSKLIDQLNELKSKIEDYSEQMELKFDKIHNLPSNYGYNHQIIENIGNIEEVEQERYRQHPDDIVIIMVDNNKN